MVRNSALDDLRSLLRELTHLTSETECVEFKHNNAEPEQIGEYISALANSAALIGANKAYMVWGIDDSTHEIVGTDFSPSTRKYKQQELESWLLQKISPKVDFRFFEFLSVSQQKIVILEIQPAIHTPVKFDGTEFIRIGSNKKKLDDFPEKERELWRVFDRVSFEQQIALESIPIEKVLALLDYAAYFELLEIPVPQSKKGILEIFEAEKLVEKNLFDSWNITNLGAILFAKNLSDFEYLRRKTIRCVVNDGEDRLNTIREIEQKNGYAIGFSEIVKEIINIIPTRESFVLAQRKSTPKYPSLSIRELLANAIIHQDFNVKGAGPLIEIFDSRIEMTNPGKPLIDIDRFLDSPPRSRNEGLASFMRRIGFCEERGSGIDKVVIEAEKNQLPAPLFEVVEDSTRCILFAYRDFKHMLPDERIRACYLHAVLQYIRRQPMNNTTLRERFGVEAKNSAMISRVISDALAKKVIRPYDEGVGKKAMRYVPIWA